MTQGTGQEWLRQEVLMEPTRPASGSAPALFELRPLSLGEVLDRIFALYRSRFWLFASIAAVSASVQVVVQAVSLASVHALMRRVVQQGPISPQHPFSVQGMLGAQVGSWIAALAFFLVSAVTQAATSLAMSEVYLNRVAVAKEALRFAFRRWYRWIGIALWQVGSFIWVPVAGTVPALVLMGLGGRDRNNSLVLLGGVLLLVFSLGGFAVGCILYLRNALAVPAAVVERLTVRTAMRRSKGLASDTKGRIFVVLLIASCLYGVVGVLESPATLLILFAPKGEHYLAQALTLLISFLGHTVVAPVALIGLTLVYFDQRVRREALDLQLLLEGSHEAGAAGGSGAVNGVAPLG